MTRSRNDLEGMFSPAERSFEKQGLAAAKIRTFSYATA
jgi:hypothetical protein